MSRNKGFSSKLAPGSDFWSLLGHAALGNVYNAKTAAAFELVRQISDLAFDYHLDHAAEERKNPIRPKRKKSYYRRQIADAGEVFINEIADALEKRDASFFRNIAIAIDAYSNLWRKDGKSASPERVALLVFGQSNPIIGCSRKLKLSELQYLIRKHTGKDLDRRQVQRLCKELGIDKHKARGRPKKGDN